jgi:hypothetical protein
MFWRVIFKVREYAKRNPKSETEEVREERELGGTSGIKGKLLVLCKVFY